MQRNKQPRHIWVFIIIAIIFCVLLCINIMYHFLVITVKPAKNPPRIPPAPSCAAEIRISPNFKNISLGFANPPSRKIVSQNRVHFFRTAHFLVFEPFSTDCVPRFSPLEKLCAYTGVRNTSEALIRLIFAGNRFEQMLE